MEIKLWEAFSNFDIGSVVVYQIFIFCHLVPLCTVVCAVSLSLLFCKLMEFILVLYSFSTRTLPTLCTSSNNISQEIQFTPFPVAERSKAMVCGRSLADVAGYNPAGGMDVCLLWVLCRRRSLRRADPLSRGVLPTVVSHMCDQVQNNPLHLPWLSRKRLD
jgi:hypothetical protein